MWNLTYLATGFIFILLLVAIFFSKEKISSKENIVFKYILIANILEYLIEIPLQILVRTIDINNILIDIFCRLYLVSITISYIIFTLYVFIICFNNKKKSYNNKIKNMKIILLILEVIIVILLLFLPFSKHYDSLKMYIDGLAVNLLVGFIFIQLVVYIILLLSNFKNLKNKKYLPIYFIIICLIFMVVLNSIDPSILISSAITTFICYTMFFTIENPDTKMIAELEKNKKLIEQGNEDKSNFLFRMSQEVKKPIDDIIRVNNIINENNDLETIKKCSKYIDYNSNELKSIVNNVLDVSKMDTYNIKMINSSYNVHNVFTEIFSKYENIISSNIDYRYNISKNIPEILYGDPVKIKQVVHTILENSSKYTKHGLIEANVDSIVKNNVCRLIISIEDSGCGMSIDKVNQLLTVSETISEEDLPKLDSINLDINIVSKIVRLLGGQLIIKSEEHVGSEFIIILEQKIKNDEEQNKNYFSKFISHKKRVLIVSDKQEDLNTISEYLKKENIEVVKSMYANECIDRINNDEKYELIIVADEMSPVTGINLLQQLKENNKFKTPIIIILDKNKESIKEHYLNDGFNDYILKENINEELDRITKKFI